MSDQTPNPEPAQPGGREPNGRFIRGGPHAFAKGNQGGPGYPFVAAQAKLRAAIMQAVTPEDFQEIARRLVDDAKGGNVESIKILFDRTIGSVKQHHEHNGNIRHVLKVIEREARQAREGLPS